MTPSKLTTLALATTLTLGAGSAAIAQSDCSALIDTLVRKKVLTAQEGENVRADLIKENAVSNAGKLNLSNSVTELKLYGDVRLREQYDNFDPQIEPPQSTVPGSTATGNPQHGSQNTRTRFRLRVGADVKLGEHFFGGFGLQTNQASDSANQTFGGAFQNYGVYIDRAFLGWKNDWLMVEGGKFTNPFYVTDLVWDPDINPDGFAESISFHKLFGESETVAGYSKDGKTVVSSVSAGEPRWDLTLNLGQLAYDDNKEDSFGGYRWNTDAWLFLGQLVGGFKFTPDMKLTIAPGYMTYLAGNVTNANNSVSFSNASTTVVTQSGAVNGVPVGTSSTVYSTLLNHSAVGHLSIITAPGDFAFKICGLKAKVVWDFAYNTEGSKRDAMELGLTGASRLISGHSGTDDLAWLAGIVLGENKKKGDLSFSANFRQTGIASIDPNINDSDFALSYLNMQGVKVGLAYNLTDFCVTAITYYDAWNLRKDLVGGQATGGAKLANANAVQVLQVDLNVKF